MISWIMFLCMCLQSLSTSSLSNLPNSETVDAGRARGAVAESSDPARARPDRLIRLKHYETSRKQIMGTFQPGSENLPIGPPIDLCGHIQSFLYCFVTPIESFVGLLFCDHLAKVKLGWAGGNKKGCGAHQIPYPSLVDTVNVIGQHCQYGIPQAWLHLCNQRLSILRICLVFLVSQSSEKPYAWHL